MSTWQLTLSKVIFFFTFYRHQIQHYTGQLARDTSKHIKDLNEISTSAGKSKSFHWFFIIEIWTTCKLVCLRIKKFTCQICHGLSIVKISLFWAGIQAEPRPWKLQRERLQADFTEALNRFQVCKSKKIDLRHEFKRMSVIFCRPLNGPKLRRKESSSKKLRVSTFQVAMHKNFTESLKAGKLKKGLQPWWSIWSYLRHSNIISFIIFQQPKLSHRSRRLRFKPYWCRRRASWPSGQDSAYVGGGAEHSTTSGTWKSH